MIGGYSIIDGIGLVGSFGVDLLGIIAIALTAWSFVNLLRTRQLRVQPAVVEIQKWRRVRHDRSW